MTSAPFELDTPIGELLTVLTDLAGYLQRIADTLDKAERQDPCRIVAGCTGDLERGCLSRGRKGT